MSDLELKKMQDLDDAADRAGGFLAQFTKADTRYDYRALLKYCRDKEIDPLDITVRELHHFVLPS